MGFEQLGIQTLLLGVDFVKDGFDMAIELVEVLIESGSVGQSVLVSVEDLKHF